MSTEIEVDNVTSNFILKSKLGYSTINLIFLFFGGSHILSSYPQKDVIFKNLLVSMVIMHIQRISLNILSLDNEGNLFVISGSMRLTRKVTMVTAVTNAVIVITKEV